ncbi:mechanosensitive ion channel domain-containing protein [Spiribacter vilamensis]|uniref:Small conductance mechanosensitive channel n=1 Tax=Spiribacter vilamensis TaxID=531306 RepID=A0A4Q8CZW2_9GAMM|nr:mechanosensitive ion channel domain-containing protein [Spiribacter vilamensis]RZU98578.1 small conductance mechanosensitive channel [Spiribacter vilamensis]TVO60163.1 mechanosensitive ion channel [Spiribacter vilamensis]
MLDDNGSALIGWVGEAREALTAWAMQLVAEAQALPATVMDFADLQTAVSAGRLIGLIVLVLLLQRVLRHRGDALIDRLATWQRRSRADLGPLCGICVIAVAITVQGAKVALVAAIGYGALLLGAVEAPDWSATAGRFLLAFVIAEIARLVINIFLEPRANAARLLPLDEANAQHWEKRLSRLARMAVYGVMFIAPVVAIAFPAAALLVEGAIALFVLLGVFAAIREAREPVRQSMLARAGHHRNSFYRPVLRPLAGLWHLLAGAYSAIFAGLVVIAPPSAYLFMLQASAISLVIILAIGFIGTYVGNLRRIGQLLPPTVRARLPMLPVRLDGWLPKLVRTINGLLVVTLLASLVDVWAIADVRAWLGTPEGQALVGAITALLGIAFLSLTGWLLAASWIEDRLNPDTGEGEPGAREKTLLSLFRNVIAIAILVVAGMIALSEIGIDIGPLLAGAGVIGLAIGFGAQTLVQDIITGVFIQLEDAIHQDDFITAAGISGTVERLSIRSLGLRDLAGTLHVVPFSSVTTVSNFTRDFGYHLGEYRIAYKENLGEVIDHLHEAYARMMENPEIGTEVTGPLEVDGVTALADSSVNIRVRIRSTPGMQWAVGRAFNRCVKDRFDAVGIEIPYPHMKMHFAGERQDKAPPAEIAPSDPATSAAEE